MDKYYKNRKIIIAFLIPAMAIYLSFEIIPVILTILFSFNTWPGIQSVP